MKSLTPGLLDLLGLALVIALIFFQPSLAGDPGVGWHLKTGEYVWERLFAGEIPYVPFHDPFLAGSSSRPWIANQWLGDALLAFIFSIGSWPLIHIVSIAICLSAFFFIPLVAVLERDSTSRSALAVFAVLVIAIAAGSIQWIVRPVLFGFLLFSVQLFSLTADREQFQLRHIAGVFILYFLWANLHSSFPLGWIVLGSFALDLVRIGGRKQILAAGAVCAAGILGTLLNPYGLDLHRNILSLLGSRYFMRLNMEWLPPDLSAPFFWPFFVLLLLVSILLFQRRKRLGFVESLPVLVLAVAAIGSRRYIPFFVLAALPLLLSWAMEACDRFSFAVRRPVLSTTFLCLMIGITAVLSRIPFRDGDLGLELFYPRHLVKTALSIPGPILNHPDLGGYIIWNDVRRRALLDDRNELNGELAYQRYFSLARGELGSDAVLQELAPSSVILRDTAKGRAFLAQRGWQVRLEERGWVLLSNAQAR